MTNGIHYAKELEEAVLGACLLEATAFGRTYGLLDAPSFYFEDNLKVYAALTEMNAQNAPIDLVAVWLWMAEKGVELLAGNIPHYLTSLTRDIVSSAHLEYHCYLLKNMWRRRELLKLTSEGIDTTTDTRKQVRTLNEQLNTILGTEIKQDWQSMDELVYQLLTHQQDIATGKKTFITTGFRELDRINGGFSPGQLIVVGARPAVGKSALAGKMAIAMARKGKTVGIVSLEMNNTEIAARLTSLETEIEFFKIYRNLFNDQNQAEDFYNKVSRETINLPIYVSDKTKVDVNEIRAKAAKLKYKHGLDCLIVDYLQLIDSDSTNKNYNREQEVARMSRGMKLLANEMAVPVIVLCQLNRGATGKSYKDRFPQAHDLRESGAIEQDADVIMMLHSDYKAGFEENPETKESTEGEADLIGVKWRNGSTFHLELAFDGPKMKFTEKSRFIPVKETEENPF